MTMTNAEWMINQGYKFRDLRVREAEKGEHGFIIFIATSDGTCKKIGETEHIYNNRLTSVILWLDEERKDPILDAEEKQYLYAVIKPFRDRAIFVKKIYHTGSYEQIIMRVKSIATDTDIADIPFPFFNEGEMYKGMELNKEYTLKELGL